LSFLQITINIGSIFWNIQLNFLNLAKLLTIPLQGDADQEYSSSNYPIDCELAHSKRLTTSMRFI